MTEQNANEEERFNIADSVKAQSDYTKEHSLPRFAPYSGQCFSCRRNIYEQITKGARITGISVEKAGSTLITGCPHCFRSFCE